MKRKESYCCHCRLGSDTLERRFNFKDSPFGTSRLHKCVLCNKYVCDICIGNLYKCKNSYTGEHGFYKEI